MAFALSSLNASMALHTLPPDHHPFFVAHSNHNLSNLLLPRHSLATSTLAFSRRRNQNSPVTSSSKKNKKSLLPKEDDDIDEDAFEALFSMLEEDLKNDDSSIDDDNDDINEEDLDKLQREFEEALGISHDDDDVVVVEMLNSAGNLVGNDDGGEEDGGVEEEEEERPLKLKNWQLRRLASALKTGRRKTSIKNLAADLCLDRAVVLELLRNPPPNLVMMSAALPDKPPPVVSLTPTKSIETVNAELTTVDAVKSESEVKVPVHVMQHKWYAQKRLKKVQVDTLERVYRRRKRPTNTMISSIVQVTNLPRKRVVKWFEDKRTEDGVPDHHLPYQRSKPETVSS